MSQGYCKRGSIYDHNYYFELVNDTSLFYSENLCNMYSIIFIYLHQYEHFFCNKELKSFRKTYMEVNTCPINKWQSFKSCWHPLYLFQVHTHVFISVHTHSHLSTHSDICLYIYIYIYIHLYTHTHTHPYIHTNTHRYLVWFLCLMAYQPFYVI